MKKTAVTFALAVALVSLPSFAKKPNPEELEKNYQACMESDSSWYNRWGAYLVSFDRDEAYSVCRGIYHNSDIRMMGCRLDGDWKNAGYYCDFEH